MQHLLTMQGSSENSTDDYYYTCKTNELYGAAPGQARIRMRHGAMTSLCQDGLCALPTLCGAGGIPGGHGIRACCSSSCGECGGAGCWDRPGGRAACCAATIAKAKQLCGATVSPPCVPAKEKEHPIDFDMLPLEHPGQGVLSPLGGSDLRCFLAAVRSGRPVRIVAFGTSVTAVSPGHPSYTQLLAGLLKHWYPQSQVSVRALGYPGATVEYMRACLSRLVPPQEPTDLFIVETVDNMMGDPVTQAATIAKRIGVQVAAIVSALQRRFVAPTPVIILAPFPRVCTDAVTALVVNRTSVASAALEHCFASAHNIAAVLESLALPLGVTAVSVRRAVMRPLRAVSRDSRAVIARIHAFVGDAVHPTAYGMLMIAQLLAVAIRLGEGGTGEGGTSEATIERTPTPHSRRQPRAIAATRSCRREQEHTLSPERQRRAETSVCAHADELTGFVDAASGWAYALERSRRGRDRPGYVAHSAGASIDVCLRQLQPLGESTSVLVGFLKSYEGMGIAEARCVGDCACHRARWDAHHIHHSSQTFLTQPMKVMRTAHPTHGSSTSFLGRGRFGRDKWATPNETSLRGVSGAVGCPCVLRVTVLNQSTSGGHKFKLSALLMGDANLEAYERVNPHGFGSAWDTGSAAGVRRQR